MKYLIILFFLFSYCVLSISQVKVDSIERPKHNISAGLLGDVSIYYISYERYKDLGKGSILITKVGIGYNQDFLTCIFDQDCISYEYLTIPWHVSANFGGKRLYLELGVGSTFVIGQKNNFLFIYPIVGLRFIPLKANRVNFRIFAQLPISIGENRNILEFPFGVNVGFCF